MHPTDQLSQLGNQTLPLTQPVIKLKSAEVISHIQDLVCKVLLRDQVCISALVKHKIIVTSLREVTKYQEQQLLLNQSDEIDLDYMSEDYTASCCSSETNDLNCSFLEIDDVDFPEMKRICLNTDPLAVGQRVYFVSYQNDDLVLHKGNISSLDDSSGNFQIASKTPLESLEGPVFIQKEGKLLLTGLLLDGSVSEEVRDSLPSWTGIVFSIGLINQLMQDTLGIGIDGDAKSVVGDLRDAVVKGKGVSQAGNMVEYFELRQSRLQRGIRTIVSSHEKILCDIQYKLKVKNGKRWQDVHEAGKAYNKSHVSFYKAAATVILKEFERQNNSPLNEVSFEFMGCEFRAERV